MARSVPPGATNRSRVSRSPAVLAPLSLRPPLPRLPPRLSIAVIFVINLSRCKNVLLRNPADLVAAPISALRE